MTYSQPHVTWLINWIMLCDIFSVFFINLRYILEIPLEWSVIFLEYWTSTGYFSNSTGSSVTTLLCLISVGYHLELCVALIFSMRVSFITQITWVVSVHTEEYEMNELVKNDDIGE